MNPNVKRYLKTLRRIPEPIILAEATRDIHLYDGQTCVCGWALRESIAAMTGKVPARLQPGIASQCAATFGGRNGEWDTLFSDDFNWDWALDIEEAFARRVAECV